MTRPSQAYSFETLWRAVELARRNLEPRAFRPRERELLEEHLDAATDMLRFFSGREAEVREMRERQASRA